MTKHDIILPLKDKAPIHTGNIITWIWYFLSPYKRTVTPFLVIRFIRTVILGVIPVVIGIIIDALNDGRAIQNPAFYAFILFGFLGIYTISMAGNFIFQNEVRVYEKAARALTLYSINHLNSLSLNWHEHQGSGGKLQRVMTGRKGFQELTRHFRWDFFGVIGRIAAIAISVPFMDVPLYFIPLYMIFLISYVSTSWYLGRPFIQLYNRFHHKFEKLLSGVYEFVSSIRTVKSFHLEQHINKKASVLEAEGQEAIMRTFWKNFVRWSVINGIAGFWLIVFAYLGFTSVLNGTMTTGAFAATFFLAYNLWNSMEIIAEIQEKIYEHGNGISRLVDTLRIQPKKLDLEPYQSIPQNWKSITLENVSYAYTEDKTQGIKTVSFTVQRGHKIAFVGNSGAGKSTLVKLLMKQMLPESGNFKIDDIDVSYIQTSEWLNNIGFVPQDVELFNLSIKDNILIDRDDIDPELFNSVLKQSALDEFIHTLPEGIDTIIGERGIKLSGGQRQRLGIARALVRQAPIIIFDEATSSLDSISENKIQTAIENSFADRTVFVIAHRLSTVRNVDRIIVLDEGQIIEEGTFEELLKQQGHFAKLWSFQTE